MEFMNLPQQRNIYLLCPVRNATEEEKKTLDDYVAGLEANGHKVHYPPRDVEQVDETGDRILNDHELAMEISHEVHIYWNPKSEGSVHDIGMMRGKRKPAYIINEKELEIKPGKNFTNALIKYAQRYREKGYIPARTA